MFHHVGIYWMIHTKEKIEFGVDEMIYHWCKYEPWYNATMCHNLNRPVFEYLFVTSRQDR